MPSAVPASHAFQPPHDQPQSSTSAARADAQRQKLQALQAEIDRIERSQAGSFVSSAAFRSRSFNPSKVLQEHGARGSDEALWFSGVADADRQLQPGGLDREGTHEIKPVVPSCTSQPAVSAAASAGALAFALQLVARRVSCLGDVVAAQPILFCATLDIMREMGRVYGPGLNELGVTPQRLLIVETAKPAETLWAMEEGLKSQTLSAVIGCLQEVALTPARRLSLAAKAHATPCLLVTGARTPSAGATASRWRVGGNAAEGERCEAVLEKLRMRSAGLPASDGAVPCSFQRSAR